MTHWKSPLSSERLELHLLISHWRLFQLFLRFSEEETKLTRWQVGQMPKDTKWEEMICHKFIMLLLTASEKQPSSAGKGVLVLCSKLGRCSNSVSVRKYENDTDQTTPDHVCPFPNLPRNGCPWRGSCGRWSSVALLMIYSEQNMDLTGFPWSWFLHQKSLAIIVLRKMIKSSCMISGFVVISTSTTRSTDSAMLFTCGGSCCANMQGCDEG